MVFGPAGSGKGVSSAIPCSLLFDGPLWVVDTKGEIFAVSHRRRQELGQRVVLLDPTEMTDSPPGALNPMDLLDSESPSVVDDAASLVRALTNNAGMDPRDRFWSQRAEHLIIGVVLHVLEDFAVADRHLGSVRQLIDEAAGQPQQLARRLAASSNREARQIANLLQISADQTLGGILAFAQSMLEFLRGEQVLKSIRTTSFDLDGVVRGDPLTIYLVLPPHMLSSHGRLLRLWLAALMTCIVRRRGRPLRNTLLLLDEAGTIGMLPQYRDAVTLMRGYGFQTMSYWQDLAQLGAQYGADCRTLLNNCRILQFLGAANWAAARDIVDVIGWKGSAEDIMALQSGQALFQVAGQPPFVARALDYRLDREFAGMFDANPFHSPDAHVMPRQRRDPERAAGRAPAAPPGTEADATRPSRVVARAVKCKGLNRLLG